MACSVSLTTLGQVLTHTFAELLAERLSLRNCGCPSIVRDVSCRVFSIVSDNSDMYATPVRLRICSSYNLCNKNCKVTQTVRPVSRKLYKQHCDFSNTLAKLYLCSLHIQIEALFDHPSVFTSATDEFGKFGNRQIDREIRFNCSCPCL